MSVTKQSSTSTKGLFLFFLRKLAHVNKKGRTHVGRASQFLMFLPGCMMKKCKDLSFKHTFTSNQRLSFLLNIVEKKKKEVGIIWGVSGRERERMRVFHLLVHFLNACNSQGLARLKPGARSPIQVSHMDSRHTNTQGHLQEAEWEVHDWIPGTLLSIQRSQLTVPQQPSLQVPLDPAIPPLERAWRPRAKPPVQCWLQQQPPGNKVNAGD